MPEDVLDRLYSTIKENYELPLGDHIARALEIQCMNLFRHWRERLKKKRFKGKSLNTTISNSPSNVNPDQWKWLCHHWNLDNQKRKSETNSLNAKANKIKSGCEAKSTARVLYDLEREMEMEIEAQREFDTQLGVEMEINTGGGTRATEPLYIRAWNKLKRHVDGKLDDEAEVMLQKFQELHDKEIQEKGADKLSIQEAFTNVLGYRPGYARGLGKGAPVIPRGNKKVASIEVDVQQFQTRETELLQTLERLESEVNEGREREKQREVEAREREKQREVEMKQREDLLRAEINADCQKKMDAFMDDLQNKLFASYGGTPDWAKTQTSV